jgi:hypothetical protein
MNSYLFSHDATNITHLSIIFVLIVTRFDQTGEREKVKECAYEEWTKMCLCIFDTLRFRFRFVYVVTIAYVVRTLRGLREHSNNS